MLLVHRQVAVVLVDTAARVGRVAADGAGDNHQVAVVVVDAAAAVLAELPLIVLRERNCRQIAAVEYPRRNRLAELSLMVLAVTFTLSCRRCRRRSSQPNLHWIVLSGDVLGFRQRCRRHQPRDELPVIVLLLTVRLPAEIPPP